MQSILRGLCEGWALTIRRHKFSVLPSYSSQRPLRSQRSLRQTLLPGFFLFLSQSVNCKLSPNSIEAKSCRSPQTESSSGMRPTGRLHIGHYFGSLQNWVKLQSDSRVRMFLLRRRLARPHLRLRRHLRHRRNSLQITIDFLASGLDPAKSTIFLQSQVPNTPNSISFSA